MFYCGLIKSGKVTRTIMTLLKCFWVGWRHSLLASANHLSALRFLRKPRLRHHVLTWSIRHMEFHSLLTINCMKLHHDLCKLNMWFDVQIKVYPFGKAMKVKVWNKTKTTYLKIIVFFKLFSLRLKAGEMCSSSFSYPVDALRSLCLQCWPIIYVWWYTLPLHITSWALSSGETPNHDCEEVNLLQLTHSCLPFLNC